MENSEPLGIELIDDKFWVVDFNGKVYLYYLNNTLTYYYEGNYSSAGTYNITVILNDSEFGDSFEWTLEINTSKTSNFIESCGVLDKPHTIYYLDNNIYSNGTCLNITSNNITVDGQGYFINYGQKDKGYGVFNYANNDTTVINLKIVMDNITAKNSHGIRFENNTNNRIINSTLDIKGFTSGDAYNYGIYLRNSRNSFIINNSINTTNQKGYGIYLHALYSGDGEDSSNNLIENNIINTLAGHSHGIYAYASSGGNIENSTILGNKVNIYATTSHGILIYSTDSSLSSTNNNFLGNNLITSLSGSSGSNGIYLIRSYNNTIKDSSISIVGNDVRLVAGTNNSFINITYSGEDISGELIRKWYLDIQINDSVGDPIENANVSGWNSTNDIIFSELTDSSGRINRQEIIEYINDDGTITYQTPHTINISLDGYITNTTQINFTLKQNIYHKVTLYIDADDTHKFTVQNSSGSIVAWFGNKGNIVLRGACLNQTICSETSPSFNVRAKSGDIKTYIDNNGNMCIESTTSCQDSDEQASCSSPNDSFRMLNETSSEVIVIDKTNGDLCLTGELYENVVL